MESKGVIPSSDHQSNAQPLQNSGQGAVRKSSRQRKKSKKALSLALTVSNGKSGSADDKCPPKTATTTKNATRKRSQPLIVCSLCGKPFPKRDISRKKISAGSGNAGSLRPADGVMRSFCLKCARHIEREKKVKKPSKSDREQFEAEGIAFGEQQAKILNNPEAKRFYCPFYQVRPCGCVQKYISGENGTKRKYKLATASDVPAGLKLPDESADSTERGAFLLSLRMKLLEERTKIAESRRLKKKAQRDVQDMVFPKEFTQFLLSHRQLLHNAGLCERGCQRVLGYSNNFLHKKVMNGPRLTPSKGKAAGLLTSLEDLPSMKCCENKCVKMVSTHRDSVVSWRRRAALNQKSSRQVIAEMLTKNLEKKQAHCLMFVALVTGSCLSTIRKVKTAMILAEGQQNGKREPPGHLSSEGQQESSFSGVKNPTNGKLTNMTVKLKLPPMVPSTIVVTSMMPGLPLPVASGVQVVKVSDTVPNMTLVSRQPTASTVVVTSMTPPRLPQRVTTADVQGVRDPSVATPLPVSPAVSTPSFRHPLSIPQPAELPTQLSPFKLLEDRHKKEMEELRKKQEEEIKRFQQQLQQQSPEKVGIGQIVLQQLPRKAQVNSNSLQGLTPTPVMSLGCLPVTSQPLLNPTSKAQTSVITVTLSDETVKTPTVISLGLNHSSDKSIHVRQQSDVISSRPCLTVPEFSDVHEKPLIPQALPLLLTQQPPVHTSAVQNLVVSSLPISSPSQSSNLSQPAGVLHNGQKAVSKQDFSKVIPSSWNINDVILPPNVMQANPSAPNLAPGPGSLVLTSHLLSNANLPASTSQDVPSLQANSTTDSLSKPVAQMQIHTLDKSAQMIRSGIAVSNSSTLDSLKTSATVSDQNVPTGQHSHNQTDLVGSGQLDQSLQSILNKTTQSTISPQSGISTPLEHPQNPATGDSAPLLNMLMSRLLELCKDVPTSRMQSDCLPASDLQSVEADTLTYSNVSLTAETLTTSSAQKGHVRNKVLTLNAQSQDAVPDFTTAGQGGKTKMSTSIPSSFPNMEVDPASEQSLPSSKPHIISHNGGIYCFIQNESQSSLVDPLSSPLAFTASTSIIPIQSPPCSSLSSNSSLLHVASTPIQNYSGSLTLNTQATSEICHASYTQTSVRAQPLTSELLTARSSELSIKSSLIRPQVSAQISNPLPSSNHNATQGPQHPSGGLGHQRAWTTRDKGQPVIGIVHPHITESKQGRTREIPDLNSGNSRAFDSSGLSRSRENQNRSLDSVMDRTVGVASEVGQSHRQSSIEESRSLEPQPNGAGSIISLEALLGQFSSSASTQHSKAAGQGGQRHQSNPPQLLQIVAQSNQQQQTHVKQSGQSKSPDKIALQQGITLSDEQVSLLLNVTSKSHPQPQPVIQLQQQQQSSSSIQESSPADQLQLLLPLPQQQQQQQRQSVESQAPKAGLQSKSPLVRPHMRTSMIDRSASLLAETSRADAHVTGTHLLTSGQSLEHLLSSVSRQYIESTSKNSTHENIQSTFQLSNSKVGHTDTAAQSLAQGQHLSQIASVGGQSALNISPDGCSSEISPCRSSTVTENPVKFSNAGQPQPAQQLIQRVEDVAKALPADSTLQNNRARNPEGRRNSANSTLVTTTEGSNRAFIQVEAKPAIKIGQPLFANHDDAIMSLLHDSSRNAVVSSNDHTNSSSITILSSQIRPSNNNNKASNTLETESLPAMVSSSPSQVCAQLPPLEVPVIQHTVDQKRLAMLAPHQKGIDDLTLLTPSSQGSKEIDLLSVTPSSQHSANVASFMSSLQTSRSDSRQVGLSSFEALDQAPQGTQNYSQIPSPLYQQMLPNSMSQLTPSVEMNSQTHQSHIVQSLPVSSSQMLQSLPLHTSNPAFLGAPTCSSSGHMQANQALVAGEAASRSLFKKSDSDLSVSNVIAKPTTSSLSTSNALTSTTKTDKSKGNIMILVPDKPGFPRFQITQLSPERENVPLLTKSDESFPVTSSLVTSPSSNANTSPSQQDSILQLIAQTLMNQNLALTQGTQIILPVPTSSTSSHHGQTNSNVNAIKHIGDPVVQHEQVRSAAGMSSLISKKPLAQSQPSHHGAHLFGTPLTETVSQPLVQNGSKQTEPNIPGELSARRSQRCETAAQTSTHIIGDMRIGSLVKTTDENETAFAAVGNIMPSGEAGGSSHASLFAVTPGRAQRAALPTQDGSQARTSVTFSHKNGSASQPAIMTLRETATNHPVESTHPRTDFDLKRTGNGNTGMSGVLPILLDANLISQVGGQCEGSGVDHNGRTASSQGVHSLVAASSGSSAVTTSASIFHNASQLHRRDVVIDLTDDCVLPMPSENIEGFLQSEHEKCDKLPGLSKPKHGSPEYHALLKYLKNADNDFINSYSSAESKPVQSVGQNSQHESSLLNKLEVPQKHGHFIQETIVTQSANIQPSVFHPEISTSLSSLVVSLNESQKKAQPITTQQVSESLPHPEMKQPSNASRPNVLEISQIQECQSELSRPRSTSTSGNDTNLRVSPQDHSHASASFSSSAVTFTRDSYSVNNSVGPPNVTLVSPSLLSRTQLQELERAAVVSQNRDRQAVDVVNALLPPFSIAGGTQVGAKSSSESYIYLPAESVKLFNDMQTYHIAETQKEVSGQKAPDVSSESRSSGVPSGAGRQSKAKDKVLTSKTRKPSKTQTIRYLLSQADNASNSASLTLLQQSQGIHNVLPVEDAASLPSSSELAQLSTALQKISPNPKMMLGVSNTKPIFILPKTSPASSTAGLASSDGSHLINSVAGKDSLPPDILLTEDKSSKHQRNQVPDMHGIKFSEHWITSHQSHVQKPSSTPSTKKIASAAPEKSILSQMMAKNQGHTTLNDSQQQYFPTVNPMKEYSQEGQATRPVPVANGSRRSAEPVTRVCLETFHPSARKSDLVETANGKSGPDMMHPPPSSLEASQLHNVGLKVNNNKFGRSSQKDDDDQNTVEVPLLGLSHSWQESKASFNNSAEEVSQEQEGHLVRFVPLEKTGTLSSEFEGVSEPPREHRMIFSSATPNISQRDLASLKGISQARQGGSPTYHFSSSIQNLTPLLSQMLQSSPIPLRPDGHVLRGEKNDSIPAARIDSRMESEYALPIIAEKTNVGNDMHKAPPPNVSVSIQERFPKNYAEPLPVCMPQVSRTTASHRISQVINTMYDRQEKEDATSINDEGPYSDRLLHSEDAVKSVEYEKQDRPEPNMNADNNNTQGQSLLKRRRSRKRTISNNSDSNDAQSQSSFDNPVHYSQQEAGPSVSESRYGKRLRSRKDGGSRERKKSSKVGGTGHCPQKRVQFSDVISDEHPVSPHSKSPSTSARAKSSMISSPNAAVKDGIYSPSKSKFQSTYTQFVPSGRSKSNSHAHEEEGDDLASQYAVSFNVVHPNSPSDESYKGGFSHKEHYNYASERHAGIDDGNRVDSSNWVQQQQPSTSEDFPKGFRESERDLDSQNGNILRHYPRPSNLMRSYETRRETAAISPNLNSTSHSSSDHKNVEEPMSSFNIISAKGYSKLQKKKVPTATMGLNDYASSSAMFASELSSSTAPRDARDYLNSPWQGSEDLDMDMSRLDKMMDPAIKRKKALQSDYELAMQMARQSQIRHQSVSQEDSHQPFDSESCYIPLTGFSESSPQDFAILDKDYLVSSPNITESLYSAYQENIRLKKAVAKATETQNRQRNLSAVDKQKSEIEADMVRRYASMPSSPFEAESMRRSPRGMSLGKYGPSSLSLQTSRGRHLSSQQESRSRNASGSFNLNQHYADLEYSLPELITQRWVDFDAAGQMEPYSQLAYNGFVPVTNLGFTVDDIILGSHNLHSYLDMEPEGHSRHRNLSSSSGKSLLMDGIAEVEHGGSRSRNPSSSSSILRLIDPSRSRNPSGSSNRRSRPGSCNSELDVLSLLTPQNWI